MFEELLRQRDDRERNSIAPLMDELERLQRELKERGRGAADGMADSQEMLRERIAQLEQERADLYRAQSDAANRLLDLQDERLALQAQIRHLGTRVEELTMLLHEKDNLIVYLKGKLASAAPPAGAPEVPFEPLECKRPHVRMLLHSLRAGVLFDGNVFGWDGSNFWLNDSILPHPIVGASSFCQQETVAASPLLRMNGSFAACLHASTGRATVWRLETGRIKADFATKHAATVLAACLHGSLLITACSQELRVCDVDESHNQAPRCHRSVSCNLDVDRMWLHAHQNAGGDLVVLAALGRGKVKFVSMQQGSVLASLVVGKSIDAFVPGEGDSFAVCSLADRRCRVYQGHRILKTLREKSCERMCLLNGDIVSVGADRAGGAWHIDALGLTFSERIIDMSTSGGSQLHVLLSNRIESFSLDR